jgi:hypothetical protein
MFCPHCGKELVDNQVFCHHCGLRLIEEPGGPQPEAPNYKTAWEDGEQTGYFAGLFVTLKEVILSPGRFFRNMPVSGGLTGPLLFALIVVTIGLTFHSMWSLLLRGPFHAFMFSEIHPNGASGVRGFLSLPSALLTPLKMIFCLFIVSGLLHFVLRLLGGAARGFEATFRAASYSASPFVFMILPFGAPIAGLWTLLLTVIGLKEAHGISTGKAAVAVFFPFILICGIMLAAAVLFMGVLAASVGGFMHMYR